MNRTAVATASLAFILGACGASFGSPDDPGTDPPPGSRTGELQLIVLPDANGNLPDDVELTCPGGPSFPAAALNEIEDLDDSGRNDIETAMQSFLGSAEGSLWPQDGWLILHEDPDTVLVVARQAGGVATMTIERRGEAWEWAGATGAESCPLRLATAKLNTVEWTIDPDSRTPGPDDTILNVVVTERQCVSGQPMGDRLLGPEIVMTDDAVYLAFAATPPPGRDQSCPGNPSERIQVDLPEPLGERQVRNGLEVLGDLGDFLP